MMMDEEEFLPIPEPYVLCAAIYYPDGKTHTDQPRDIRTGFVVAGRRHSDCYYVLELLGIGQHQCVRSNEGFISSNNLYMTREEAFILATQRKQIINIAAESLISENLYYP